MSEDNRNMLLAVVLSLLVFVVWQRFVMPRVTPAPQTQSMPAQVGAGPLAAGSVSGAAPAAVPGMPVRAAGPITRAAAMAASARVTITAPKLSGSINLRGAQFDDLTLSRYNETIEKNSPRVRLLNPAGTSDQQFAQFGWFGQGTDVPTEKTLWSATATTLTPTSPVTLFWDNNKGQRFELAIAVDGDYLFTITQRVRNTGTGAVTLQPYGLVQRVRPDHPEISSVAHEGLIGGFTKLEEIKFKQMHDADARTKTYTAAAAWFGFTDKYWLTAIIPDVKKTSTGTAHNLGLIPAISDSREVFQVDMAQPAISTPAGGVTQSTSHFFAGAKEVDVIRGYYKMLGATKFDFAIDWGMFYFLTQPFFWILHHLYLLFNNFGLAIIGLTFIVKALFFPIANKQYESFAKMKQVGPKMKELQEKYKEDRPKMQQEIMELYKREKVNPLGGCLPIVLQIPVFYALYKIVFVTIESRHQPFFGWIRDLSAADPLTPVNLFGLLPFTPPSFGLFTLAVGVLPLIMGLTMYVQQKLQPMTGIDPAQQQIFKFMPVIFTLMMAPFAAGIVLYWITNNILSIFQQKWINARIERKLAAAT